MIERPPRCPFCANTDLARVDSVHWSCVGSLGCGGVWDPAVVVAPPPRAERVDEADVKRSRREMRLRAKRRLLRRRPLPDAA